MGETELSEIKNYILDNNKHYRRNILLYLKWVLEDFENRKEIHSSVLSKAFNNVYPFYIEGIKTLNEWNRISQRGKNDFILKHKTSNKIDHKSGWLISLKLTLDEAKEFFDLFKKEDIPAQIEMWKYEMPEESDYISATEIYDESDWTKSKKKILINNEEYQLKALSSIAIGIKNNLDSPANFYMFTTNELKNHIAEHCKNFKIIEGNDASDTEDVESINNQGKVEMPYNNKTSSLNQILYGPPGTGKTYDTINKALEIIFEKEDKNTLFNNFGEGFETDFGITYAKAMEIEDDHFKRKVLKRIFDLTYAKNGQIEFVTFHQSYGYEEFVEGIKAIPVGEEGNDSDDSNEMIYTVVAGIFKKLSNKANENYENSQIKSLDEIKKNYEFNCKLELLKDDIRIKNEKNEKYYINDTAYILSADENYFRYTGDNWEAAPRNMHYKDLEMMYINNIQNRQETVKNENLSGLAKQHATYFFKLFEKLKKQKCIEANIDIAKGNLQNYILIIDEINRGNISKIFGELITLIEPSKRIGKEEVLHIRLPHSGDSFGVPSNLYIIGTMNTADRSIAQIDTALRRRFVFEEMMPKPKLLINKDDSQLVIFKDGVDTQIDVVQMLIAINERIEYIYDREHTIGHSYFMDLLIDDCNTKVNLDEIFRVNIIPLLAEYFYGDWNDIKIILNDTGNYFITEKESPIYIIDESKKNNKIYTVNQDIEGKEGFSIEGYKNIYKKTEVKKEDTNSSNEE